MNTILNTDAPNDLPDPSLPPAWGLDLSGIWEVAGSINANNSNDFNTNNNRKKNKCCDAGVGCWGDAGRGCWWQVVWRLKAAGKLGGCWEAGKSLGCWQFPSLDFTEKRLKKNQKN